MKYRNKHGFLAIALALLAGGASTQSVQAAELNYARGEAIGNGTFKIRNNRNRNESNPVSKVTLAFEQNQTFDLRFTPTNSGTFNVSGRWSRSSSKDTVNFTINRGGGLGSYSGNGTLYFQVRNGQRQPGILKFTGQRTIAGRVADFDLKFNASGARGYTTSWDRDGGGSNTPVNQLFSTKNGSGRVEVANQRDSNVRRAKVELSRNGDARIELTGSKTWVFEGRWTATGTNRIRVKLDSASSRLANSSRWLGEGEILLKNGSFDRLDLAGKLGRDKFEVTFRAN